MQLQKDASYVKIDTEAGSISGNLDSSIDPSEFTVLLHSGIGINGEQSWISELSLPETNIAIPSVVDSVGEWSVVAQRHQNGENEFVAFTDNSGFGSLFYSLVPGKCIIISDSFHGAIRGLEQQGINRTLDLDNYLTAVHLTGVEFRTHFSSRTMANEVRLLTPGSLLHISSSGISVGPRSSLGGAAAIPDYDTAVDQGLSQAHQLLSDLHKVMPGGAYTHLSGGVDSRIILAMISSFGLTNLYPVYSGDPRGLPNKASREVILHDVRIADMLRREYSFEWWEQRAKVLHEVPLLAHLRSYQSFRSNVSFQYSPMQSKSSLAEPQVSLRGGGGEMLRTTGRAANLAEHFLHSDTGDNDSVWLAATYMESFSGNDYLREKLREYIVAELQTIPADSIQERVNRLYFETRNQAHFGHMRSSLVSNELPVHVLTVPGLIRASELLPVEERYSGKLVMDIFQHLGQKDMLSFPLESPFKLANRQVRALETNDDGWASQFDRINKKVAGPKYAPAWRLSPLERLDAVQFRQAQENFITMGLNVLQAIDAGNKAAHEYTRVQIVNKVRAKRIALGPLLAKIASALDAFYPPEQSGNSFTFSTKDLVPRQLSRASGLLSRPTSTLAFGTRGCIHEPKALVTGSTVNVSANFEGVVPDAVEYAFYLRSGGKKIAERWYSPEGNAEFELPDAAVDVSVESFVRLKYFQGIPFRAETQISSANW